MSQVRLRSADPTDAGAIAAIQRAAISELGATAYDDRQLDAWLAAVDPDRYPIGEDEALSMIVAERDDRLVGFGLLDCEPADRDAWTGEIIAVYVRPDDARTGIGRTLLTRLEAIAQDANMKRIVLVASKNAIGFYRRQGYEGVETVSLDMADDVALEALRMRKRL